MNQLLLLKILANPRSLAELSSADWDLLVRQARSAGMLARLAVRFREQGLLEQVPRRPRRHLQWAEVVTDRHADSIRYEVAQLLETLAPLGVPMTLLKGAAYTCARLSPAEGRLFVDIDILLPKAVLPDAEVLLERGGWLSTHLDAYDQKYYRQWMHELPPLKHGQRQTELDVHHAIVPETARVQPDSESLLARAVVIQDQPDLQSPLSEGPVLQRLCNEDLILHSATHLFFDGEFTHGLRDLDDIDSLLRELCRCDKDWSVLLARAQEQQLSVPLFYALHFCRSLLGTPVPDGVCDQARQQTGLPVWRTHCMVFLIFRGLLPDHGSCHVRWLGFARFCLYVRSHYLKMPLHLLLPHLFYKSVVTPWKQRIRLWRKPKVPTMERFFAEKKIEAERLQPPE